ncbi:MAG: hypothetical protein GY937_01900 [bacterium]|nr:hypothetical protein [bacterium]
MYRSLDPQSIADAAEVLARRIGERFHASGLEDAAGELVRVAREVQQRSEEIAKPNLPLRIAIGVLGFLLVATLVIAISSSHMPSAGFALPALIQVTEGGINVMLLFGGAAIFLLSAERRLQRRKALAAIHELRALAHVVDMRQLTKDPQRVLDASFVATASSPSQAMSAFEISRYLDYCSEIFALIGKLAAVYARDFEDSAVIASAGDVEALTTGLSRKVWQKLMILRFGPGVPSSGGVLTDAHARDGAR